MDQRTEGRGVGRVAGAEAVGKFSHHHPSISAASVAAALSRVRRQKGPPCCLLRVSSSVSRVAGLFGKGRAGVLRRGPGHRLVGSRTSASASSSFPEDWMAQTIGQFCFDGSDMVV